MKKTMPTFATDAAARDFVDTANLADYDLSGGRPARFEFEANLAYISPRGRKPLLEELEDRAKLRGTPIPTGN